MSDDPRIFQGHIARERDGYDRELGELLADVRRIADGFDSVRLVVERAARDRRPALDEVTAYGVRVMLERLSVALAAADRNGLPAVPVPRADVRRVVDWLNHWTRTE